VLCEMLEPTKDDTMYCIEYPARQRLRRRGRVVFWYGAIMQDPTVTPYTIVLKLCQVLS
jgi:hypothetical protein